MRGLVLLLVMVAAPAHGQPVMAPDAPAAASPTAAPAAAAPPAAAPPAAAASVAAAQAAPAPGGLCVPEDAMLQIYGAAQARWGAIDPVVLSLQRAAAVAAPCRLARPPLAR